MKPKHDTAPDSPDQLFDIDSLLDDEEKAVRSTVRQVVDERVKPHVAGWYEAGQLPARELATQLGEIGLLGMHMEGYGCAGMSATAYGLACLELEAGDSGIRSLVSVHGSLAMYAIHAYGSEDLRAEWLPRMATGETIGCFGVTEPAHGSGPGRHAHRRQARRRRLGAERHEDVDHERLGGRRGGCVGPNRGRYPRFRGSHLDRRVHRQRDHLEDVTARVGTSELVLDGVRLPSSAVLPGARGRRDP